MLQLIVEAQKEIVAEAIKAWKEEQKGKVKDNEFELHPDERHRVAPSHEELCQQLPAVERGSS